jgi:pyruvate/2-oxoglutarate/acetoin dehydrogenase E1 component
MKQISYVRAINEALREEMERDDDVFILGLDVGPSNGAFTATRGLYDKFGPDRVKDYPISESSMVGLATGAAAMGLRPVVEIMFMDFMTVCLDPLVNAAAKLRFQFGGQYKSVPLTIRTPIGEHAGADHTQSLEAWFAHIPGLKVVMPGTVYDVKGLLKSSIRDDNPVVFVEHIGLLARKAEIPEDEYVIPLGKAEVKREGNDVTLVSWGRMIHEALAAAEELSGAGISVEVIDPLTLSPLDTETILKSVRKTGKAVIAHEAVKTGGFGGEIAATIAENALDYLDAPIRRVGALSIPLSYSPVLEDYCLPNRDKIVSAVKEIAG